MARLVIFVASVVLVALLLTGHLGGGSVTGSPTTTSIAELNGNPGRWEGNPVRVTGQVGDRLAVLGYGGFMLRDHSGSQILVVGISTPAGNGQTTTVTGKFIAAFAMMDITMPVILAGAD